MMTISPSDPPRDRVRVLYRVDLTSAPGLRQRLRASSERFTGEAQQGARVWADRQPAVLFAAATGARIVACRVANLEQHLDVEMRRPIAVVRRRAEPPDAFAGGEGAAFDKAGKAVARQVAVERVEQAARSGIERPFALIRRYIPCPRATGCFPQRGPRPEDSHRTHV